MKRWLRRLIKLGLIGIVLVLAIPILLFAALQISQVRALVVDRALSQVNKDLAGTIEIDGVEGTLLGSANLKGLRIWDGRDHLSADIKSAEIQFRVLPLLGGSIIVDKIAVDDPTIVVHLYDDEVMNWELIADPEIEPDPGEPFDWPVNINQFTISNGAIAYMDSATDLNGESPDIQDWRGVLSDLLDTADSGASLRNSWDREFDPDRIGELAGPRAPMALWFRDLDLAGDFRMLENDLEVALDHLHTTAHADILETGLALQLDDISVNMGATSLHTDIESMQVPTWLEAQHFRLAMNFPQDQPPSSDADDDADPFEQIVIDFGQWRLDDALFQWAAPEVPLATPLSLQGEIGLDPNDLQLLVAIDSQRSSNSVKAALELVDYTSTAPSYELSLDAVEWQLEDWVEAPELPALQTSLYARGRGQGFEPDELEANIDLRLDDTTIDNLYEVELVVAEAAVRDGVVEAPRLAALSPYLDLFASAHFDPAGELSIRAQTTADDTQSRRAAALSELPARAERAEISLELDALFEPDADPIHDGLTEIDTALEWNLSGLDIETLQVGESNGDIALSFAQSATEPHLSYRGNYRINATGQNIAFFAHRVGSFSIGDHGEVWASPLAEDLSDMIHTFENNASIQLRSLRTPDAQLTRGNLTVRARKPSASSPTVRADITSDLQNFRSADLRTGRVQLNGNASVDVGPGQLPVDRLRADLRVTADRLNVDEMEIADVDTRWDTDLRLRDGPTPFEMVRQFNLDARASAGGVTAPDQDLVVGPISTTAKLEGQLDDPRGTVNAEVTDIEVAGESIPRARAQITMLDALRRGRAALDIWRTDSEPYGMRSSFSFGAAYESFELDRLELSTKEAHFVSTDESRLRWTGSRVEADDFHLEDQDQWIYTDGHFHPGHDQDLRVGLSIDIEEFIIDWYLQPLLPAIEGQIDLAVGLQGTSRRPQAELVLDAGEVQFLEFGLFSGHITAAYDDERLAIEHMDLSILEDQLFELSGLLPMAFDLEGYWEVFPDRHSELDLHVFPRQLRDLHEPLPMLNDFGIDGLAELDLEWSGTLDRPTLSVDAILEDFQFQGELGDDFVELRKIDLISELSYESVAYGGRGLDLNAVLDWEDKRVLRLAARTALPIEEWLVAALDEELPLPSVDNAFLDLPLELQLQVPSFDLERLPLESLRDESLAGIADIDIDMTGTIADPQGSIELDLRRFGWRQFRNLAFDLDATIEEHRLAFERMDLAWGSDEIFASEGIIPLPLPTLLAGEPIADLPLDFRWHLHDLPVSRFSAIDYEFARVQGYLAASIELSGSLRQPRFQASAGLHDTRLGDGTTGSIQAQMTGANNQVSLQGALTREAESFLSFDGRAPILLDIIDLSMGEDWQLPGPIRANVASTDVELENVVPTQLLTNIILDPEGLLDLELQVGGDWADPSVAGHLQLRDGAITLPEFARGFSDINTRIDVDDEVIEISQMQLRDGPSSLGVSGTIEHELFIPGEVDLEMNTDEFNVGGFGTDFPLFVSAEIAASGSILGDPGTLDIHVSGLELEMNDEWDRTLHETTLDPDIILVRDGQRPGGPFDAIFDDAPVEGEGLNLVLNVTVDRRSWARHPAGDINFMADLNIEITGTIVTITGTVDTLRGSLEFLGRRFELQRSEITFTGNVPPDPRLRIEAFHYLDRAIADALGPASSGEPRIMIQISGTAEQPRLQLRADPPMNDTEILFVLMTGRPPDRSDVGRDEGVANQALSAASGLFFGMLQDEMAGNVPFDVVRLEPGEAGIRGGRLEVGTYLSSNAFFSWRRQLGADEEVAANTFRLEYHFLPRWMIEVLYTDRNEGGLNLFWDAL